MIKSRKMITIENSLNHFLKDSSNYITEAIPLDNAKLIPLESLDLDNRLSPDGSFLPAIVPIQELGKNLLKAASDGNIEEIKALMSRGAPFTADWLGACPLHYAATNNHSEACEVLLRAGVSRNSRTKVDRTPLHMASYEGHIDVVEVLLNHRADYDCQDMLQMTPLHWAAQNAHSDIVTALVRHGCNTTLTNKFQLTASDIARQMGRGDLVEVIEAAVRDPVDPTEATDQLAMELMEEEEGVDDSGLLVEGGGGGEEDGDGDGDMLVESDRGGLKEELYDDGSVEYVDNGYEEVERRDEDIVTIENVEDEESETNPNLEEAPCENDNEHVENIVKNTNLSNSYTESMKILQEHGIEMLPPDEHNILSSAMETGHTVALTEAGKQALNAIKPAMPKEMFKHLVLPKQQIVATPQVKMKKIITLTAEEFLAMTTNGTITTSDGNILKKLSLSNQQKNKLVTKRIVMKKSKVSSISQTMHPNPMSNTNPIQFKKKIQMYSAADYEALQKKLREANQLVEIYKKKFLKKEEEAERFKHQLKLMLENST